MADLSEEDKVATLMSVTGVEDLAYCTRLLEAHGFDLEAAVNTAIGVAPPPDAMGGGGGGSGRGVDGSAAVFDAHRRAQQQQQQPVQQQQQGGVQGGVGGGGARAPAPMNPLLALPLRVVKGSLGIVFTVIGFGFKVRARTVCILSWGLFE
jgi:FAS-associated factor 2